MDWCYSKLCVRFSRMPLSIDKKLLLLRDTCWRWLRVIIIPDNCLIQTHIKRCGCSLYCPVAFGTVRGRSRVILCSQFVVNKRVSWSSIWWRGSVCCVFLLEAEKNISFCVVMLLPNNNHFYENVTEKTKLFAAKCLGLNSNLDKNIRDQSCRGRFRFCVCSGSSKKSSRKVTAKWYIKVNCFKLTIRFSVSDRYSFLTPHLLITSATSVIALLLRLLFQSIILQTGSSWYLIISQNRQICF